MESFFIGDWVNSNDNLPFEWFNWNRVIQTLSLFWSFWSIIGWSIGMSLMRWYDSNAMDTSQLSSDWRCCEFSSINPSAQWIVQMPQNIAAYQAMTADQQAINAAISSTTDGCIRNLGYDSNVRVVWIEISNWQTAAKIRDLPAACFYADIGKHLRFNPRVDNCCLRQSHHQDQAYTMVSMEVTGRQPNW